MLEQSKTVIRADRCIYCMRTQPELAHQLGDEHIIPESLNGALILPRASCRDCGLITSRFEQTVSRQMYGRLRLRLNFKTKRKKSRPKTQPVRFVSGDDVYEREVQATDLPVYYLAVRLPPPGIILGVPRRIGSPELHVDIKGDTEHIAKLLSTEKEATILNLISQWHWGAFSRLIAKIGHAYTVSVLGLTGWRPLLPPVILGQDECLSHLTGGVTEPSEECQAPNDLVLATVDIGGVIHLVVRMSLLGFGRLPTYQAVVGAVEDWETVNRMIGSRP